MKKTVPLNPTSCSLKTLASAAILTLAFHCSYAGASMEIPGRALRTDTNAKLAHSIQVTQSTISKKNKIRLYPDARQEVLFFSVNGAARKVYQLYMYDMDGKLVNQAIIRDRETTVLTNISEGNYLYEVFCDDERIGNGKLSVK